MYPNNASSNKPIIKFLFVFCFSFLNCPAFSEDISRKISAPNTETGYLTVSEQGGAHAKAGPSAKENVLHSVWKISNSSLRGTAFAIAPNQMITNFHILSSLLENEGSLEDIVLTQSVSSSQLQIQRVLKVSALYDLVLFETKETVSDYLKLDDDLLDPEEELSIVGYPKDGLTTIQKTGNIFQEGSYSYFPMNAIGIGGASGSPVLNIQGEVVGAAYVAKSNLLIFTKAINIQKFLSGEESTLCSSSLLYVKCLEQEITNLRQMSEEGSAFVQYMLAFVFNKGIGTEINLDLAFEWSKKSAEQDFAPAQDRLAYMYTEGIGTEVNLDLAFYWYKKSAEQDFAPAQFMQAYMYTEGMGTEVNLDLAFYWSKRAAEQGLAFAQYMQASMYKEGMGTEVNLDLAFYWYKKSAEQDFASAQNRLAYMYTEGIVTEVNLDLAFYWYKKSAEQDFAPAQYMLAYMYTEGIVTEVNLDLAFYWYKKSAEQGFAPAQDRLAYMYKKGIGTEVNLDLAFYWSKKAAE